MIFLRTGLLIASNLLNARNFTVLAAKDTRMFIITSVLILIVWVMIMILDRVNKIREENFAYSISNDIRQEISNNLIKIDVEDYHQKSVGTYLSWLNSDIQLIETKGILEIIRIVYSISGVIFSIISLLVFHWSILLVTFIGTGIMLLIPKHVSKVMRKAGEKTSKEYESFVTKIEESLQGYDTFYALNALYKLPEKVKLASLSLKEVLLNRTRAEANVYILNFGVNVLFQVLLTVLSGLLFLAGYVEIGIVTSVGSFANLIFEGLTSVSFQRSAVETTQPIFEKFKEIERTNQTYDILQSSEDNIYKVDHLSYYRENKRILSEVDFTINKGDKILINGPSGSGKSTLVKLLTGQLKKYEGHIYYKGIEISKLNVVDLLEEIIILPQKPKVFSSTVRENINLVNEYSDEAIVEKLKEVHLPFELDFLEHQLGSNDEKLSRGQVQRLVLARALLSEKKILILDESFASIDRTLASVLEEAILNNPELTVIMISHTISEEIKSLFDQTIMLNKN